ncbi:MAG: glycosyltransferase family 39 protein [Acidobacteriota bacterium]|nr:MAG: glycosyltransferase family 39 protein [Acidobacteriota bacterium]
MAKKKKTQKAQPQQQQKATAVEKSSGGAALALPSFKIDDKTWMISAVVITAISALLRFVMLAIKPLHHDEGVNGFFLTNLVRDGAYRYDPSNYHGPTLYYLSLPFVKLFGLETVPIRVSVAIFGVLCVVLVFYLRRYLGDLGTLFAALFMALSPGLVYISRYFIHEIFFIFLAMGIAVAIVLYIEGKKAGPGAVAWMALILFTCFVPSAMAVSSYIDKDNTGLLWAVRIGLLVVNALLSYFIVRSLLNWDEGRPMYLILASACVSLMFATKETAFITLGTMAIACVSVYIWRLIRFSKAFETNITTIIIVGCAILAAGGVYYSSYISDALKWMGDVFMPADVSKQDNFSYFTILFLIFASIAAWAMFLNESRKTNHTELTEPADMTLGGFRSALGSGTTMYLALIAAAVLFAYIWILFFSSFFTFADGIKKSFEAYAIWTKTGNRDHTMNGPFAYLKWGMRIEAPILLFSAIGAFVALLKGKHRFAMFAAFWAWGLFVAYTIIPYKTPWLAISFLMPMCLVAGYAIGEMLDAKTQILRLAAVVLAIAGTSLLTYQTYQLNFQFYDDDRMPYVYAHTKRGFLDMVDNIEKFADKSGKGKEAVVEIVSPDYWPLTWYMLEYKANFHGRPVDANTAEMIVAKKDAQDALLLQKYANHYKWLDVYPLRPGVNLVLLVRNDIAPAEAKDISKLPEYKTIPGYTQ